MGPIFLIIIGAAAGFLATRVMDIEASIPATIAVGVLGALIGGVVLRFLMATMAIAGGFIGAVLGALLLIWIWQTFIK
ncbi:MAG: GlsB/YeaQ/YmgE family stress response membrane protein [Rhodobacteraceae bacterium]|nr:GlsB/YeaQ/YmgE family stress response membrane protein [Paracoccaceae bacterium]